MPIHWSIEPLRRRVHMVIRDPYDFAEWSRGVFSVIKDPTFGPGFSFLVDPRQASAPDPLFVRSQVEFFARHAEELAGVRGAAVVRPDNTKAYGSLSWLCASMTNHGRRLPESAFACRSRSVRQCAYCAIFPGAGSSWS